MQRLFFLALISLVQFNEIAAQNSIQLGTTNPPHPNDVYGVPCQQIERTPNGSGVFVFGTYNTASDDFDGLQTGSSDHNRFLAAYDGGGNIRWVRGVARQDAYRTRMVYAPSGDLFFGSQVFGTVKIGNTEVVVDEQIGDIAIGRYDTTGNFKGAFTLGMGATHENLYDLDVLGDGTLLALLTTDAQGQFHNYTFPYNPAQPIALLVARYTPQGAFLDAYQVGSSQYDFGNFGMAILPNGDWAVGGSMFSGLCTIGGQPIPEMMSAVGRWSPVGSPIWVKPVVSTGDKCLILHIAADPSTGDVAFTGYYNGQLTEGSIRDHSGYNVDVLVGKMRGSDGQILWSRNGDDDSNFSETGQSITVDAGGNVYVTGNCKGGLKFRDGQTLCEPGPYHQAFLAKFNANGSFSWGNCDGYGTGTDAVVLPDPNGTVFSVGTNASGVSGLNTNFFNHWENGTLLLNPLPQSRYCAGDRPQIQWTLKNGIFPANSSVSISIRDDKKILATFGSNQKMAGESGTIAVTLPFGIIPPGVLDTVAILIRVNNQLAAQTAFFEMAQAPVPEFLIDSVPACIGRTDQWLQPYTQDSLPEVVAWEPAAAFVRADSIAARLLEVMGNDLYKVTFSDTTTGCFASDSVRLATYDFSVEMSGPDHVFGDESWTYETILTGQLQGPFSYDWSDNFPAWWNSPQSFVLIDDTTRIGMTVQDFYGCRRSDTLLVIWEPARVLRGRVMNHDSTTGMAFTPIQIYQKDTLTNELILVKTMGTYPDGTFSDRITNSTGDTICWLRVVPDSLIFPLDAPTWFDRKYFAQNAVPFSIAADTVILPNIRLHSVQMLPDSNGVIGGAIELSENMAGPAQNLVLWLADKNRQPLRYTVTNQQGAFLFDHLPFGKFYLLVDRLGINNALAPSVVLDAQHAQNDHLAGILTDTQLFLSNSVVTNEPTRSEVQLNAWPNPFTGRFSVTLPDLPNVQTWTNLPGGLFLEISDPTGRLLHRQVFSGQKIGVERGDLPGGLLFLSLKNVSGAVLANGRVMAVFSKN